MNSVREMREMIFYFFWMFNINLKFEVNMIKILYLIILIIKYMDICYF